MDAAPRRCYHRPVNGATVTTAQSQTPPIAPPTQRRDVLGIRVDDVTLDDAIRRIRDAAARGERCHVVTLNPEYVMRARRDPTLRGIIARAALVTADGAGITQALRLAGTPIAARITGNDLTHGLARAGVPLFLLGAAPGVAAAAAARLRALYPQAAIVGTWPGDADVAGDAETQSRIDATEARVVLVAYGMPKQDEWIDRNLSHLDAPVAIGVGGTFDYLAGTVARAPAWMRARGLEWLYRLVKQPWRWRRIARVLQFATRAAGSSAVARIRRKGMA